MGDLHGPHRARHHIDHPAYDPDDLLCILLAVDVGSSMYSLPKPDGCPAATTSLHRPGSSSVAVYLCAHSTPVQRPSVCGSIRLPHYELLGTRTYTRRSDHELTCSDVLTISKRIYINGWLPNVFSSSASPATSTHVSSRNTSVRTGQHSYKLRVAS